MALTEKLLKQVFIDSEEINFQKF